MGIIIKYILKNIWEKKFRTFLIVISVTCSAALFFASSGIAGTLTAMYEDQMRMTTGNADLIIHANERSPSSSFRLDPEEVPGVELIAGEISMGASYRIFDSEGSGGKEGSRRFHLRGFHLDELQKLNPIIFSEVGEGREFAGNWVILSQIFAEEQGYKTGDSIDIEIDGNSRRFKVWGIAYPTGIFRDSPQSEQLTAVIPRETAAAYQGLRGQVIRAYVIMEPGAEEAEVQQALQQIYRRYEVEPPFTQADLSAMLGVIVMPLYLMTSMVLMISVFIIYSTFKVITVERLPVIGTFRSIGATRRMTDWVLMGESLAYGLLGGVLGNVAGVGVLYLIASILAADPWSGQMDFSLEFGVFQMTGAFLLAVGVSLISSWIPIKRVSKTPIKELVLNLVEGSSRKKNWKTPMAVMIGAIGWILPRAAPHDWALPLSTLGVFMTMTAVIFAVPLMTQIFLKLFERLMEVLFGNLGLLAAKNLKDNTNILNNITLLTIGISVLLMINTLSYSVGIEVLNAYRDWKFDIMVSVYQADRSVEQSLRAVPGVKGTYAAREYRTAIQVKDPEYTLRHLQGVNSASYQEYMAFRPDGDSRQLLEKLSQGRYILVADMMRHILQLEVGDRITMDLPSGLQTYEVIGFYDSLMMNGSNAMIDERYYRLDLQEPYPERFYVRVDEGADPGLVLADIRARFRQRGVWGETIRQLEAMNDKYNEQLFTILKAFSVLAMIIGVFGVFNNYMISFIQRKRALAIMKSVGMSKTQSVIMIMAEALVGGCIAGLTGVFGGITILMGIPYILEAGGIPINIHFATNYFVIALAGGVFIALTASLSPALRGSKLNVIDAIKYE
ncbi:putative ABC transport system permease protein [Tindallia magadiensis]|uniref:Putative ABC transport system permease protein n=1 Tax=Tindallia magadiensis TaxID=69895 RepID=A0A1I3E2A5_9FIRM|nr:ABC transporter permease [Tindallia magadiensis]SFH92968.1 putative ABC transport system permease protein [Tindallia magadiensis]